MLELKPVFHNYNYKISKQIKKRIAEKFIEQISQCVLSDILNTLKQSEIEVDDNL